MNSTTTMWYLYRNIIIDVLKCVEYLKSKNLLSNNRLIYSKKNNDGFECVVDDYVMKQQGPVKKDIRTALKKKL